MQNEEKVDVGEVFYTSGDDRVFPKGLPIGTATVVRSGKTFKEIYIVPAGTQNGLEEVLVVIEGVHQAIPDPQSVASSEMYVLPEPPGDKTAGAPASDLPGANLSTDADRLRERYKRIGAAQNHVFGDGLPGAKPPNFNLNPDAAIPGQQAKAPIPTAPGGVPAGGQGAQPVRPIAAGTAQGQPQNAGAVLPGSVRPNTAGAGQPQIPGAVGPAVGKPPQSGAAQPPKPTTAGQPSGSPTVSPNAVKPLPSGIAQPPKTIAGQQNGNPVTAPGAAKPPQPGAAQPPKTAVAPPAGSPSNSPAAGTKQPQSGQSTQIKSQQPPGTAIVVTPKPVTPKPVKPVQANPPQEAPPNL